MLYKKNHTPKLDMELFKNPTSEYRAAPFWAWNCELESEELLRQIECLKEMGMGGFHMHTRSGMATKYLSDEFMQLVKDCVEKAKKEGMLAWLYDEDRWPSGAAGGYVTKTPEFRERMLLFTVNTIENIEPKNIAIKNATSYLLGEYDVVLNENGELASYKKLEPEEAAKGTKWYAYIVINPREDPGSGWFNGGTYVDTLNPKAMERFIEITHEAYKKAVGEEFGKTVPAIFTDEPQFSHKQTLPFAESKVDVTLPWTPDFDETYEKAYGFDIKDKLPELFWELPDGEISIARYYYHDHICERFTIAFSDLCGKWCRDNGIYLTGHMMEETTLKRQTAAIGEAMRAYRSFELPGVDMLCNLKEFDTVKQAQSASRQYGREGLMSELYGVTNWDFDFRGHKYQGDWQAAMGVTTRVHHLSWVSMKGSAKRDYPASINYQSPWYKEYSNIEDHFARLNTVLTRGKSVVNVGVIHPIESYWLHWGPADNTSEIRTQMDKNFENILNWLLFGTIDFDFISESCLPSLCGNIDEKLQVGAMQYSAIVVPACETLRSTTVEILNKFIDNGGKVIFAGDAPKYVDAIPNEEAHKLFDRAIAVPFDRQAILNALSDERDIEIKNSLGNTPEQFIYQMKKDGDIHHLFIANPYPDLDEYCKGTQLPTNAIIKIKGEYTPTVMNTLDGVLEDVEFEVSDGYTTVYYDFYESDSLLLSLAPCTLRSRKIDKKEQIVLGKVDFKNKVSYSREEDNVCILDLAEYSIDGGPMQEKEEILRIDKSLRQNFCWPLADGSDVQPWVIEKEKISHFVTLKFTFDSESTLRDVCFCCEELEELILNGEKVTLKECGYFVDKSIRKYTLPEIIKGENVILAKMPFGKRTSLEACFLTGDFNVKVEGCCITLLPPTETIGFGNIVPQGLPFYGGNITYSAEINVPEDCDLIVNIGKYVGALTKIYIDGEDKGALIYAPYDKKIEGVKAGKHTIEFKLFGNRYNTFGALHACGINMWYGPNNWYQFDNSWCYEYNTKETGILKSPVITMVKKKSLSRKDDKAAIIFKGDDKFAYRDPACYYHNGTYYLFFTFSEKDSGFMYMRVGMSKSKDLKTWSETVILTPKDLKLNYCSPGNVIEHNGEFILCFTSYPMPFTFKECWWADDTARVFIMRTKDFKTFTEPEILMPKGNTSVEELGRMIDPFLIKKDDYYYLFFKQNGVSFSRSKDLKNWEYLGNTNAGENVCILKTDEDYLMLHSPDTGISFSKSKDLINWEEISHTVLKQREWEWAERRLTAGFAMESANGFKYKYIIFFHGSVDVYPETHGNSTLAMAFTDDFKKFYYEI